MKNPDPNPTQLLRSLALDTPMSRQPFSVMPEMLWPALFAENFEGTYNWRFMPAHCIGDDYVQAAAGAAALTGLFGLQLKTKSTTPASADCVAVCYHAPTAPCDFIRYQGAFCFVIPEVSAEIGFWLFFLDGEKRWKAGIRFFTTGRIDTWQSDGYYHQLPELHGLLDPLSWQKFDVMIDVKAHKYVYAAANAIRLPHTAAVEEYGTWDDTGLALDILLYTRTAALAEAWVDQLLVTPHRAPPIL